MSDCIIFIGAFIMHPSPPPLAWLDNENGGRIPLGPSCSIGRGEGNDLVLRDQRVSRRHAMIHRQGEQEFWLVDFGSRNGTYVNGCRIAQPTCLNDGDNIVLGNTSLLYRQSGTTVETTMSRRGDLTMYDVRRSFSWLLIADVVGSTALLAHLPPDELPLVMGQWLVDCREIIEKEGGRINQFMGDGFFAQWPDHPGVEAALLSAMQALRAMQAQARPEFRLILHFGEVVLGGVAIGEEERIAGSEVHFAFRMEKLAGSLGLSTLVSEAAWQRLAPQVSLQPTDRFPLPGFEGDHAFFTF